MYFAVMIKILSISTFVTVFFFSFLHILFPLPDDIEYSTTITDRKGNLLHAFLTKDDKWRMHVSLEDISPLLRRTIVYKEDKYFYRHFGVNPFAITRAFVNNLFQRKHTSGASTITMQVARALERKPRNYFNKLTEIFRAYQLELKYNKNEILQLYCNLVPYGGNIEGIKAASYFYLKKDPDHLSLAEITALSIIPNRPSSLAPGKHNTRIQQERNRWLNRFAAEKIFTRKEIADALAEPVGMSRTGAPKNAPHLSWHLKKTAPGPAIVSTIDPGIQAKSEKIVSDYCRSLKLKNIHNAAVVIIDNRTHEVITYIGSSDFRDTNDGGQVNGINAIRQPGSTLKPLVYGMCIDEGFLTPKAVITDVNVNYEGYAPENYDRRFNGYVTVEYALAHSLNIPAVKSLNMIGKDRFVHALAQCDFSQIKKDRGKLGLSMILGGCGTTLMELAGLYSAIANEGKYHRPKLTTSTPEDAGTSILSKSASFMISEILSGVDRPDFPLNWQSTERMPKIAWKTGTSYGRRDAWSIGFNKKYTVAVWTGNFSGTGVPELSGSEIATPLLFRIFNTIDYDSDQDWYSQPADCDFRVVCPETGKPPADFCLNRITDYFIPLISSAAVCDNRKEIALSPDGSTSYCKHCLPASGYRKKWFRITSPEMQNWMEERNMAYDRMPPHYAGCEEVFRNGKPAILSPRGGVEYLISKKDPEALQLQCRAGDDVSKIFWYIDNRFYKSADASMPEYFVPNEGPVKISCTDDKGRNRDVWITVKYVDL